MSLVIVCSSCLKNLKNLNDVYTITKCGHVYHEECLRKIIFKRTCSVCHVQYDSRQCRKLHLFSESNNQLENNSFPYKYDWMYCDHKTTLDKTELATCFLKLGTDWKTNDIYAARVFLNKQVLPAYYIPVRKCAVTTLGGHAYEMKEDIELLDISSDDKDLYKWMKCESNQVPENALNVTEFSSTLEPSDDGTNEVNTLKEQLFIARAEYNGKMLYGKLSSGNNGQNNELYLAFESEEIKLDINVEENCEVLVRDI